MSKKDKSAVAKAAPVANGKSKADKVKATAVKKTASKKSAKKQATPEESSSEESSSEEEEDDDDDESSSEEESSEEEEEEKSAKKNGAAKKVVAKAESESDSSEEDSDDSEDSEDSEDDSAAQVEKSVSKPAANGKADASSEEEDSDDSSSEEDDDSSDEDSSDDEEMEEAAAVKQDGKKRKADIQEAVVAKKAKADESQDAVEGEEESKTVWVGQLSWNVDDDWLKSEFAEFGEVASARVVMDRESGKSRGFGYVDFVSADDAKKASVDAQGKEVDGRALKVDLQKPRAPREQADARAKKFNDQRSAPSTVLFVGGLAWSLTEDEIWEAFGEHGEVTRVTLPKDIESGRPKGFGYIEFGEQASADKAIEALAGAELGGRRIRLDYAPPRTEGGGGGGGGRGDGGFRGGRGGGGFGGGRGGGRGGGFGGGRGGGRGGGFGGGRGGGRGGSSDGGWSGRGRGGFGNGGARTGAVQPAQGKKMTFDD